MNKKKRHILRISLLTVVMLGAVIALAYFNSKDSANNIFTFGNKYTLTYHANTGKATTDADVTVPDEQKAYGNGTDSVEFTVSSDKPVRPGFVFTGWYEKATPDTTTDTKYGSDGTVTYTAPANQYESNLYAQWQAGYTLIYDANGGEGTPDITQNTGENVAGNVVTVITNDITYKFENLAKQGQMTGPKQADGTATNRVFLGWSEDKNATEPTYTADGNLAYANTNGDYDKTKVSDFTKEVAIDSNTNPSKTVTLYAVWATKYELSFSYHPEMTNPKCGDSNKLQKPITLVSASNKTPTFTLMPQADADTAGYTPTREEGYRWGWWGDNLERFKFNKPGEGQTAAQAGNEGCYQFGEPVPARTSGDTSKAPNWNNPTLTLYAYFQPPSACSLSFDDNSRLSNGKDNPKYPGMFKDEDGNGKNDLVTNMPDDAGASTTENVWKKVIPNGKENTPVNAKWSFIGWSEDRDSSDPEYQPGDTVSINKVLKNKITLYAIWKPMHNFRLTFDRGYKTANGSIMYTGTNEYYVQNGSGVWKSGGYNIWFDSNVDKYEVASTKYFTDKSFTWPAGFFSKRGFFATKDDDTVGTYKFLGWSWKPQVPSTDEDALMATVAFPVTIPDNPASILNKAPADGNTIGVVNEAITVTEKTPCTKPATHGAASNDKDGYTLYAVYRKSPLHQLRIEFVKGSADAIDYKGTKDGTTDVHLIDINGTTQSKDKYYASLDYPSYTWDTTYWETKTPSASKNAATDGTATYTFLGWTTDETKKDPSTTITKKDIDYPVDDSGNIKRSITVKEDDGVEAKDCAGGIHKITLYPVFKKNIKHVYTLKYDVNAPSKADGVITELYRKGLTQSDGTDWKSAWVYPDPNTLNPKPDPLPDKTDETGVLYSEVKELTEKSYKWDMSDKGFFATCENTGNTPTGEYTFLGWSYTKFKLGEYDSSVHNDSNPEGKKLDFPITEPSDVSNIGSGEGVFGAASTITIDTDETDPSSSEACTDEQGKVHTRILYGVWSGEPLHQYSVIFAGNSDASKQNDVKVVYGTKDDFANESMNSANNTLAKTYKKDGVDVPVKYYDATSDSEIALTEDIKNIYRVYSEAFTLPDSDPNKTDSYTFESAFWNDSTDPSNPKDLIVKAERTPSDDYRYVFKGWNTKANGTGTAITTDADGYITTSLTIKDKDYDNCDSYTHNIILYAQWDKVKIHKFQLIFSNIDANSLGYMDSGTWKNVSSKYISKTGNSGIQNYLVDSSQADWIPSGFYGVDNSTDTLDAEGIYAKASYSWGESGDSSEKLRVMASKNKDASAEYEFLGWSKTKVAASESNTTSDVDYTVDADGYIQDTISINELDTSCAKSTHTLVLYPVFKRIPVHNFSVTLNLNGGTRLRAYNAATDKWSDSSTYTYYKPDNANANTKVRISESRNSYTWSASDFWSKNGFGAYRNYDSYFTYELVGWSRSQMAPSLNPDLTGSDIVAWTKHSTEYATSDTANMTPYVNGFIGEDITVSCDNTPCTGGSHNVTLYAVWKKTPRVKTYTLKFDANGGENAPDSITQTATYDEADMSSWNSRSFALTNQQITDSGMKNKKLVFVGWHEKANADQGKYGEKNTANNELEQLTQNLTSPYIITNTSTTTTLSAYTTEKTLYAIWWFEYMLEYDANGGSGAPEHEHVYTSDTSYSFRISNDVPTHASGYKFLGWSETQVAAGQGTEDDVQFKSSTDAGEIRYNVTAAGDSSSDDYGYTGKKLYAVWGPAN